MKEQTAVTLTWEQQLDTTARDHSWRMSFTTSCVRGTSPSAPPPNLRFSREAAQARAALHARMEAHCNLHASSTFAWRMRGSDLAFARARSWRKILVSLERPPPRLPEQPEVSVSPHELVPSCVARLHQPELHQVWLLTRHSGRVHGQLQPKSMSPHHHVHRHATSSLPANSGCCTLDRETPSAQHPCSRTRCAVVAKRIQREDGHNDSSARREREWETKTCKEHTQQGRVNACQEIRRSHRDPNLPMKQGQWQLPGSCVLHICAKELAEASPPSLIVPFSEPSNQIWPANSQQEVGRAEAHRRRRAHADCESCTSGILSRKNW